MAEYKAGFQSKHSSAQRRNHTGRYTPGKYLRPSNDAQSGEGPSVSDPDELPPTEERGDGPWIDPNEEES